MPLMKAPTIACLTGMKAPHRLSRCKNSPLGRGEFPTLYLRSKGIGEPSTKWE